MIDNTVTQDDLETILALSAMGMLSEIEGGPEAGQDVMIKLAGSVDNYIMIIDKAAETFEDDTTKACQVLCHVLRETYSSVVRLSNIVN